LLRELEADVLLANGGSHRRAISLAPSTKGEAGSELRATGGADHFFLWLLLLLLLLSGKCSESRGGEALRLRAGLMGLLTETHLLLLHVSDLAVLEASILCIFHHSAKVGRV
jgi:hypothetical protein